MFNLTQRPSRVLNTQNTATPPDNPSSSGGDPGEDTSVWKHHPVHWYDDGNVVIVAKENTAFRVHLSVLSQWSVMLGHLLENATLKPLANVEGCPCMRIPDDSRDFAYFLTYIYDTSRYVKFFANRLPSLTPFHSACTKREAFRTSLPSPHY